MKTAKPFLVVLVTAPTLAAARALAGAVLKERLVACANILPGVESHYRWRDRLERSREALLILKTRRPRLRRLEKLILEVHPYDTPEIIALPLTSGNQRYLRWLEQETA